MPTASPAGTRSAVVLPMLAGEARVAMDILARLPEKLESARGLGDVAMTEVQLAKIRRLVLEASAKAHEILGAMQDGDAHAP